MLERDLYLRASSIQIPFDGDFKNINVIQNQLLRKVDYSSGDLGLGNIMMIIEHDYLFNQEIKKNLTTQIIITFGFKTLIIVLKNIQVIIIEEYKIKYICLEMINIEHIFIYQSLDNVLELAKS